MLPTLPKLEVLPFPPLQRDGLATLQVNLGYRCNLQCKHCHVNAGPKRREMMAIEQIDTLIDLAQHRFFSTLDLTGGAPELHPHFRQLVGAVVELGIHVIDRCNLTVLDEPGQDGLADFLAGHGVEVIASLPCYLGENVDAQRGKGVFASSMRALQRLNQLGYGRDRGKSLSLVYNPQGASLPPPQQALERDYKQHLMAEYGIVFDRLLTITNMPIQRFGSSLLSSGEFDAYMRLLQENFHPDNLRGVMCRNLVSVDWQGRLYDCDFNQMLQLPMRDDEGRPLTLDSLSSLVLQGRPIEVRGHCFGCTAGQGSSCGGAL